MSSTRNALLRALAAFAVLLGMAALPASAAAGSPATDPFYAAPSDLAELRAGEIIRSRRVVVQPLPGLRLPLRAYHVLYRTNDSLDRPVATAATVILPWNQPTKAKRRLVSVQIAYDGLSPICQPSYTLRTGTNAETTGEFTVLLTLLSKGWTVVTSDYEGPMNTWIAGKMAGQGVLDGIRATEDFAPAGLPGRATQVGMIGYSGGGHATAWANELSQTYAPELNLVGSAQGGVPANLPYLLGSLNGSKYAGVMFAAIAGLRKAYPDAPLDQYITPKGQQLFQRLQRQCITDFAFAYPGARVADYATVPDILAVPEIRAIADANTLGQQLPKVPTFMYHATDDTLVAVRGARELAEQYCAAGVPLIWRTTTGDHTGGVTRLGTSAISFLAQRFRGAPMSASCPEQTATG